MDSEYFSPYLVRIRVGLTNFPFKKTTISESATDLLMLLQLSPPPRDLLLHLQGLLPLGGINGGHVLGGSDEVQDADAGLEQADDPAEPLQPVEPACGEMQRLKFNIRLRGTMSFLFST